MVGGGTAPRDSMTVVATSVMRVSPHLVTLHDPTGRLIISMASTPEREKQVCETVLNSARTCRFCHVYADGRTAPKVAPGQDWACPDCCNYPAHMATPLLTVALQGETLTDAEHRAVLKQLEACGGTDPTLAVGGDPTCCAMCSIKSRLRCRHARRRAVRGGVDVGL